MTKKKSAAVMAVEAELARRVSLVEPILSEKITDLAVVRRLAVELIRGADEGLEFSTMSVDEWVERRFKPQLIWLSADDYTRALVRALWLARKFAGTDFGSSRQRDVLQVWTDTARGFAGEIALAHFLQNKYALESRIDTTRGNIEKYLSSDIAEIRSAGKEWRAPKLTISVKATKFNGRWLDVPGAQISHSDVFVLTRLGISRGHFLGFMNEAGFVESLIERAMELDELSEKDAQELRNEIPASYPLPVYIPGFVDKRDLTLPIHMLNATVFGRTNKRILVTQGVGLMTPETIHAYPAIAAIPGSMTLPIEIEPIVKGYTGQKFLAHSGAMKFGNEWDTLATQL